MSHLLRKKGSVLVFSLIILSIVLSSALSITMVNVSNRKSAASTAQSVQSFSVADTATEKVMQAVYNGSYPTLYALYHDGLSSMACGEDTALIDGAPSPLVINSIVSQGVGSATVTLFDTAGSTLTDCTATNWRDTLASVKVEGSVNGTVRVIEVAIAPLSSMAWGENGSGQLGDGSLTDKSSPVSTIGGSKWKSVSAGGSHVLAVKEDGTLWAWGNGAQYRLGNNNTADKSSPVQIGTDNTWESVSTGTSHSLGIKTDHSLWVWGNGASHRLGTGNASDQNIPVQITNNSGDCVGNCPAGWKVVSAGSDFSLAIGTDDSLWSWGNTDNGRLGHGENGHKPAQVAGSWKVVSAGENHVLAIDNNDKLYAWGLRDYGKLGGASSGNQLTPIGVGIATDTWIAIAAGDNHSLGIKSDHSLWAWGNNDYGQLGGSITGGQSYNSPQLAGAGWQSVFAGNFHSLGVLDNGGIWAWGRNNRGQIGNGSTGASASANILGTWKTASAGGLFSIAVRE